MRIASFSAFILSAAVLSTNVGVNCGIGHPWFEKQEDVRRDDRRRAPLQESALERLRKVYVKARIAMDLRWGRRAAPGRRRNPFPTVGPDWRNAQAPEERRAVPGDGRQRMARSVDFTFNGFIVHAMSPGFNYERTEDWTFYCAGAGNKTEWDRVQFKEKGKERIRLLDCYDALVPQIFWQYTSTREVWLWNVSYAFNSWYMEVGKYTKNKRVYIDPRDIYDPHQLWDLRPGGNYGGDRTWRPMQQLGDSRKGPLCISSSLANGTLHDGSKIKLKKCSNKGRKRKRQTWYFCFEGTTCQTRTLDPPDFTIKVDCEETGKETLRCNDDVRDSIEFADAVPQEIWKKLEECDDDPVNDKKFDQSLTYEITDNRVEEYLDITLDSSCGTTHGDLYLRVYKKPKDSDKDDFHCIFIGRTNCKGSKNIVKAAVSPQDHDFIIVVSADSTDKTQRSFDLDVTCTTTEPPQPNNPDLGSGDSTNDMYCGADVTANVDENDDLPSDFDDKKDSCRYEPGDLIANSDILENATDDTAYTVDTFGIEKDLVFESRCNKDGKRYDLQTLIRIYEIVEDDNGSVAKYDCVESGILDCGGSSSDRKKVFDVDQGKHLVVATGAVSANVCDTIDFDCN